MFRPFGISIGRRQPNTSVKLGLVIASILQSLFLISIESESQILSEPSSEVLAVRQSEVRSPHSLVQLNFELKAGYHAYLDQFQFEMLEPDEIEVNIQNISPTVNFYDRFSKRDRIGVESTGKIELVLRDPRPRFVEKMKGVLRITYQACSKEKCLLPKRISLPIEWQTTPAVISPLLPANPFSFAFWLSVFVAGVLTSLTPCVFPLIPITLAVLGSRRPSGGRYQGLVMSLSYVLGMATTYACLGVIAASTGALFGQFLGHPVVAIALAILFIYLALAMIDIVHLQTPLAVVTKLHLPQTRGGFFGAYLAGLLAGVVASPCVGPILAAILTFVAQTQNRLLGFGLLFTFAFGMGQLFLALGTFTSLRKYLPKSGPWMNAVKYIFALTFIGLAIFYLKPVYSNFASRPTPATKVGDTPLESGPQQAAVRLEGWEPFNDQALQAALTKKSPVVIDFFAEWCAACKEMEEKTFPAQEVKAFQDQVIFLRFDATQDSPEFAKLKNRFQIVGLPHFVFLDPTGAERKDLTLTGFEGPAEFQSRLKKLVNSPAKFSATPEDQPTK